MMSTDALMKWTSESPQNSRRTFIYSKARWLFCKTHSMTWKSSMTSSKMLSNQKKVTTTIWPKMTLLTISEISGEQDFSSRMASQCATCHRGVRANHLWMVHFIMDHSGKATWERTGLLAGWRDQMMLRQTFMQRILVTTKDKTSINLLSFNPNLPNYSGQESLMIKNCKLLMWKISSRIISIIRRMLRQSKTLIINLIKTQKRVVSKLNWVNKILLKIRDHVISSITSSRILLILI